MNGKGGAKMKDITKELEKMVDKLEKIGKENNYTLTADGKAIEKMKTILDNLFTK